MELLLMAEEVGTRRRLQTALSGTAEKIRLANSWPEVHRALVDASPPAVAVLCGPSRSQQERLSNLRRERRGACYIVALLESGAANGIEEVADEVLATEAGSAQVEAAVRRGLSLARRGNGAKTVSGPAGETRTDSQQLVLRTEEALRRQAALLELAATAGEDTQDALERIVRTDARTLGVERVSFWTLLHDPQRLECRVLYRTSADRFSRRPPRSASDFPEYFAAIKDARVIEALDARRDPRTRVLVTSEHEHPEVVSLLDVPVWTEGVLGGVLTHESVGREKAWSAEDRQFAVSIAQLIALALEVGERRRAESQLRASEGQYRNLVETSHDLIWSLDLEQRWSFVNRQAAERFFGCFAADLLGRPFRESQSPEDGRRDFDILRRVFGGEAAQFETVHYRRDGSAVRLRFNAIPLRDAEGRIVGATGTASDVTERHRRQVQLARFRAVLDHSGEAIFVCRADRGQLLDVNETAVRWLGMRRDELVRSAPSDLFAFDEEGPSTGWAPYVEEVKAAGRPLLFDSIRLRRKDGETFPVEVSLSLHSMDHEGYVVAVVRDITGRWEAEEARRQSEQRLQRMVEHLPAGAVHREGDAVSFNKATEQITGYARDEIRSVDDWFSLLFGENEERFRDQYEQDRRDSFPAARVFPITRKDGQLRSIEFVGYRYEQGEVWLLHDITERRRAEEARRESEARFRALFQEAPDAILIEDEDDRILDANPAACEMLGYTAEELRDLYVPDIQAPECRSPRGRALRREPRLGQAFEGVDLHRDGRRIPVEVRTSRLAQDGKDLVLSIVRDITQRKQIEAQMHVADRLTSVGTLAAGVAHEINNPLATVSGNLSYALELLQSLQASVPPRADELQELNECLIDAMEGSNRVRDIVSDLKTFARGGGRGERPMDVHRALDAAVRMTGNEIRHRALLAQERRATLRVRGNESGLAQVFVNLLLNAAHAMPEDRQSGENRITITTYDDAEEVIVEVRDNGEGMHQQILARIFDPFFTTKSVGVGTGLGLAVCHGIVSSLRGRITVESEPDVGSRFRVHLPATVTVAEEKGDDELASHAAPARSRVLAVDDEPLVLNTLRRVLEKEHYVVAVSGGIEALERLAHDRSFDVILCDLMMPGMSGMQLYEKVEQMEPALARRFLFLTGGAFTNESTLLAEELGSRLIEKPLDSRRLRAAVRRFLRERPE